MVELLKGVRSITDLFKKESVTDLKLSFFKFLF